MIRHIWAEKTLATRRRSFTLTELLVTIAIISILMTIAWGAIGRVREQGRVAKTKATIAKINQIIMERYDSYRTRRVPIDTRGLPPRVAAMFRLWAIRCTMAWEMPDRDTDVRYYTTTLTLEIAGQQRALSPTTLARRIAAQYMTSNDPRNDSAELLYLIVTLGSPESREFFGDDEIADTDGDGLKEFVDAWGHPIAFIRQPVGFADSDIQLCILKDSEAPQKDHDPFDPLRVDPVACRTVPLIYSAGPDGEFVPDEQGRPQMAGYGISMGATSAQSGAEEIQIASYFAHSASASQEWVSLNARAAFGPPPLDPSKLFLNTRNDYTDWYGIYRLAGAVDPNVSTAAWADNIHNHRAETMP